MLYGETIMVTESEMSLKEVAGQYGPNHRAAKTYDNISALVDELNDCNWLQFINKNRIAKKLHKEINR